ncbi:MAG: MarR family winged helix-turn-helix transcriptional regulator [Nitrososphaerota archaeon]
MPRSASDVSEQERKRREELYAQLQTLGETASTESALFHQAAAASYGLGITDMKTLGVLLQEGAMTAGQIAKRLSLTTGAVTNLIDRLERQDLVKRMADPKDRRKVIVVVNQETLASGENVYLSMGEAFNRLYESYTTDELEFLVRYHQAAIELTKQEIAKLARKQA